MKTESVLFSENEVKKIKKGRKVVRLETKAVPFSMLEDLDREMFQLEVMRVVEKGSKFVQALR